MRESYGMCDFSEYGFDTIESDDIGMSQSLTAAYFADYHNQNIQKRKEAQKMKLERNIDRLRKATERRQLFTPDFMDLKHGGGEFFPVFVYGDEKIGKPFQGITKGCKFYGRAYTTQAVGCLFENKGSGNSAVCFKNTINSQEHLNLNRSEDYFVEGELYGMPLSKLCDLDRKNNNGAIMVRETAWVRFDDIKEPGKTAYVKAFMYFGVSEYWKSRPKGGEIGIRRAPLVRINQTPIQYWN